MTDREKVARIVRYSVCIGQLLPEWENASTDDRPTTIDEAVQDIMDNHEGVLALLERVASVSLTSDPAGDRTQDMTDRQQLWDDVFTEVNDAVHDTDPAGHTDRILALLEQEPVAFGWIDCGDMIHVQAGGRGAIDVPIWDSPQRDSDVCLYLLARPQPTEGGET